MPIPVLMHEEPGQAVPVTPPSTPVVNPSVQSSQAQTSPYLLNNDDPGLSTTVAASVPVTSQPVATTEAPAAAPRFADLGQTLDQGSDSSTDLEGERNYTLPDSPPEQEIPRALKTKPTWRLYASMAALFILTGGFVAAAILLYNRGTPKVDNSQTNSQQAKLLTVAANQTLGVQGNLKVSQLSTLQDLTVNGKAVFGQDINVTGNGTFGGNVSATYFIGDGSKLTNLPIPVIPAIPNVPSNVVLLTPASTQTGDINISGALIAASLQGSGAAITSLNASNLSSGTVADARLSANVALLDANNTFTGTNSFSNVITQNGNTVCDSSNNCAFGGGGNDFVQGGNAFGAAANLGTTDNFSLNFLTNGVTQLTLDTGGNANLVGTLTAAGFSGSGAALTSLNASNLSSGTVANTRLSASVTLQGNSFNAASQLVQLNASGELPALSGVNLTNLNASNLASGTVADARLSGNVPLKNGINTFTALNNFTGGLQRNGSDVCDFSGNCTASGGAGGDLTGNFPNPTIAKLQGTNLAINTPAAGHVLIYNGSNGEWENQAVSGDIAIAETGVATIGNGAVSNTKLQNSSLTVTAGSNLSGGGLVALGGTITLDVVSSPTFSGDLTVQGATATIGTNLQQGSLVLNDGAGFAGTLQTAGLSASTTYVLPESGGGTVSVCVLEALNCVGAGGGVTTAGGTPNQIAKFLMGGQTIGDSILSDDGSTVTVAGNLQVNSNITVTAGGIIGSSDLGLPLGNGVVLSFDAGSDNLLFRAGGRRFLFPTSGVTDQEICTTGVSCAAGGGQAVILQTGATPQTDSGGDPSIFINNTGGGDLIHLQGGGSDKFVVANNGNTTITGTLLVKAATTTIGTNVLQGKLVLNDGAGFTGTLRTDPLSGSTTYVLPDSGGGTSNICTLEALNCVGAGGGITGAGNSGKIAKFSGGNTIADSTLSETGTVLTASGTLEVSGGDLTLGTSGLGGNTGVLKLNNDTNANTVSLQSGVSSSNLTFTLPTADGSANQCIKTDSFGALSFGDCLSGGGGGGGGVVSLNSQSGVVTLNNAQSLLVGTVTIDNAVADGATKGIAAFNSTNFSDLSGVINTKQDIATSSSPTFAGLTLSSALTVANGGTGAGTFTSKGVIYGNSTSALQVTAAGTSGQVLVANASGVPTFVSLSGDIAVDNTGLTTIQANSVALGTDTTGNYVANLGSMTGLTVGSNTGEGSTPTLAVIYGATSNTAVQGNTTLTCPSAAGNASLSGTGNAITLGSGGSCNAISLSNTPSFTSVTATGASSLNLGVNNTTAGSIVFNNGSNVNTTTLNAITATSTSKTVSLPDENGTLCIQGSANCGFILTGGAVVLSVNSQSGALTLNDTGNVGTVFTIHRAKADASTLGLATFNATDFQDNGSGLIDTAQGIAISSSPIFSNLTLQGSTGLTLGTTSNLGKIIFTDGTNDGFTNTLDTATLTVSNKTIVLPNLSGTVCVTAGNCLGGSGGGANTSLSNLTAVAINTTLLPASAGSADLGSAAVPFGSLYLSGSGTATTSLLTPLLDTPSGTTTLNIGTTNATAGISLRQSTTVAATKSLTVTSGATTLSGLAAGSSTALTVNTNNASNVGVIVKGSSSQTGDLVQLQDSTGTTVQRTTAAGNIENLGQVSTPFGGLGKYGNFVTLSEEFDSWTTNGATVSANSNSGPDGTSGADLITSSSPGQAVYNTNTGLDNTFGTLTFSVWLRASSTTVPVDLEIFDWSGSGGAIVNTVTATTTWQRFSVTGSVSGFSFIPAPLICPNCGGTGAVQAWGAQINRGSIPTVYVHTFGNTVNASTEGVVSNGGAYISSRSAADVGLTITGVSSQSADWLDVNNSAGTLLFGVGSSGTVTVAGTVTSGTSTSTLGNPITLQPGATTLASPGAGAKLNLLGGSVTGSASSAGAVFIQGGNTSYAGGGTGGLVSIKGGTANGSGGIRTGGDVNIDAGTGTSSNGGINIGTANLDSVTVQIGNTANVVGQTINIGNNTTASSTDTIAIGNLLGTSGTTVQGGTGSSAVIIKAGSAGTINIGNSGVANTINIGNVSSGAVTQTIKIGTNSTGSSTTNITIGSTIAGTTTLQSAGGVIVSTLGTADTPTYLCRNSSNIVATCQTTATGSAFIQGGNSFGATGELGTNDGFALNFRTNNGDRLQLGTTGNLTFQQTSSINTASAGAGVAGFGLTVQAGTAGTDAIGGTLTLQAGTSGTVTSGAGSTGGAVSIQATAGTAGISGSNGGVGGAIGLTAGTGGSTSGAGTGGIGGAVNITGGLAGTNGLSGGTGGAINLTGGHGQGLGSGGAITLQAGGESNDTGSHGGSLTLSGGTFVAGGNVSLKGGSGLSGTIGGGNVTIQGGVPFSTGTAGKVIIKPQSGGDIISAVQIQNSNSGVLFNVDTSTTSNLVTTNNSFEGGGTTSWAAKGSSTLSAVTTQQVQGNYGLSVATTTAANDGAQYSYTFGATTQYTLSLYLKVASGSITDVNIGRQDNGSNINCLTGQTVTTTWTRFNCTFTTGGTISSSNFYVMKTGASAETFFVDAVQLEAGSTVTGYNPGGQLQLLGNINSPVSIKPMQDSTTVFNIQNAAGATLLNVDTVNGHLQVYNTASSANYADIYWCISGAAACPTESAAVFAANTGKTQIGNGTGDVSGLLSNNSEKFSFLHNVTSAAAATSSDTDFVVTRQLVANSASALTGNVAKIEDLSSNAGAGGMSPTLLYINQNSNTATGNLIVAQTGGSTTKFSVTTAGNTTVAGTLNVAGLLTSTAGATINGGTISLNGTGSSNTFIDNSGGGDAAGGSGTITLGNTGTGGFIKLLTSDTINLTGTTNINTSGSANTGIGNGSSGTVTIGNSSTGAISVVSGGALTLTGGAASTWSTSAGNLTVQAATTNTLILNTGGAGTVNLGTTNTTTIGIGNSASTNTVLGVTNINASANFATNINSGNSTGAVTIGNSLAGAISIQGSASGIAFGIAGTAQAVFAGSSTLYVGNASTAGTNAAPTAFTIQGTTSISAGVAGGALTVVAGTGSIGGAGGQLSLTGGTAGSTGTGGAVALTGGSASGSGNTGGAVNITGGTGGTGLGIGGGVTIATGAGTSISGIATFKTPVMGTQTGGSLQISTNWSGAAASNITLSAGTGGSSAAGIAGGNVTISAGAGDSGVGGGANGGNVTINAGAAGNASTAGTISIGNTNASTIFLGAINSAVTQNFTIGSNINASSVDSITLGSLIGTSNNLIQGGTSNTGGSEAIRLQVADAGGIALGSTTQTGTITIGNATTAATQTVSIESANGNGSTQTINIGGGSSTTSGGKVVNIANGTPNASTTNTVAIGTGGSITGTVGVTIGSAAAANHTLLLQGGNSNTSGSEAIRVQTSNAGGIALGSTTQTGTITLGNATTATTQLVNIESANGNGSTQTIEIGGGSSTTSGGKIVNIGNGTPGGSTTNTIAIGTGGTTTGTVGITIGSNGNAAHTTAIQGGSGATAITFTPQTTGQIVVGASGGTGQITLGSSSSAQTVAIGNGTGAGTVNIANVQTGGAVAVGSGMTTGTITLGGTAQTGTLTVGQSTDSMTLNIGTGVTASGKTLAIHIGDAGASGSITNITLGSTTTSSTLTVQSATAFSKDVTLNGHLVSGGSAISSSSAGAAACTSPPAPTVTGNDIAGTISVTTGTGCAGTGTLVTVNFVTTYTTVPKVLFIPTNAAGAGLKYYAGNNGATSFTLDTDTIPADGGTYTYNYFVIK